MTRIMKVKNTAKHQPNDTIGIGNHMDIQVDLLVWALLLLAPIRVRKLALFPGKGGVQINKLYKLLEFLLYFQIALESM